MKKVILSFIFLLMGVFIFDQEKVQPCNPNGDAKADLKKAIELAKKENKHVLVQFGVNWCPWCLRF